jgi:hypothetical protein
MWVDDPAIGCGERPFVVTTISPERVRLFSCSALVEIEVARREFDRYAQDYESDPAAVMAILRRNVASAARHRLDFNRQAASAAESALVARCAPLPEVPWQEAA